uniref:Pupal cuticle protein 36-like n=1 Tax=Crassostrea virginica TaxID=6565 RepID=A0A8B8AZX2_CRAVI|nr:pupal cuticle protein 36-like [Crassostrea virginica]
MNALFVLSAIAASFIAGVYCDDYSTQGYSKYKGSYSGGGGGGSPGGHGYGHHHGGHGYGHHHGGHGYGHHHGGHGYGPIGGGGGPHHGGPGGGSLGDYPKTGTCPPPSFNSDTLQLGPSCYHDENCHGVQKCCPTVNHGPRCQIPVEYQRSGTCNTNYVYDYSPNPPYITRRACNHDHTCPYKCCRRSSSGQVDTCTYPPSFGGPYPGIPGRPGNPGGPGRPVIPYPPVTGPGPVYPPKKVY